MTHPAPIPTPNLPTQLQDLLPDRLPEALGGVPWSGCPQETLAWKQETALLRGRVPVG